MSIYSLDTRRLLCPLPVIRVQNKIKELLSGDILEITATDPGVLHDIPAFCRIHGHEIISTQQNKNEIIITLKVLKNKDVP
jgi:tRNA 2-thiouridine synthesizing protein A